MAIDMKKLGKQEPMGVNKHEPPWILWILGEQKLDVYKLILKSLLDYFAMGVIYEVNQPSVRNGHSW